MIEPILKTLYEQGPQKITELADEIGCTPMDLSDDLADLVIDGSVYLEIDGTFWFALGINEEDPPDELRRERAA